MQQATVTRARTLALCMVCDLSDVVSVKWPTRTTAKAICLAILQQVHEN